MTRTGEIVKILCVAWVVFLCTSCVGCMGRLSEADIAMLDKAATAYKAHDDRQTLLLTNDIIYRNPGTRNMEPWHLRGMAKFRLSDLNGAEADLTYAMKRSSDESLKRDAMATLGEIAYLKGDMKAAADKLYAAVGDENWRGLDDAQASFKLACALQWLGKWEDADLYFQRIDYLFPDSDLARQTRKLVGARAWTLVLGRFPSLADAQKKKDSIQSPADAVIAPVINDDKLEFVLSIGRSQTHDQAVNQAAKLSKAGIKAEISVTR